MYSKICSVSTAPSIPQIVSNNTAITHPNTPATAPAYDRFTKAPALTTPDNYTAVQEPINPSDAKYLSLAHLPDGSEIHFPPDNASLAAKKAWIAGMKKLSPEQQAFTQAKLLFSNESTPESLTSPGDFKEIVQKKTANISSYQTLFTTFKADMEQKLHASKNPEGIRECQEMIQAWDTLLTSFAEYNVK